MRSTLMIDDDVFDAASQIARTSGQRVGRVLSELARRGLNPGTEVKIVHSGRFPSFAAPPGVSQMDAAVVQRVLDEEGF